MTTLADLRFAAQSRADRINATSITTTEWNLWVNASAAELYGKLTSLYEDYNVKIWNFTLTSGEPGNQLQLGFGTGLPDFDKLRKLSVQVGTNGTTPTFAPILRCNSLLERDRYTSPSIEPYYGAYASAYLLYGNILELLPPQSAAGTYRMWYVPRFLVLAQDDQPIDGTWMSTNGIDEFIVLGTAIKALVKEESLDTANLLAQLQGQVEARLIREFAPRDDNQPGKIVQVKRSRRGWGYTGFGGPGNG